ncbi:TonB family protein [Neorhizobium sp. BETTINA12A]|uniref:cell envelope integrity protein TolA n=1 Tax=Neorhizobium sp. BETTINA12A TaxID=2908924 RepID=UPI001FF4E16E|nr:energy transducer TonB [Neorhizobium sp. BETTINA12A]MCJ9754828.1 TonB family protein [Neorhizobium sp. BETTINA12A]
MSLVISQTSPGGRVGELALWGAAGLLMLTVHFSAAAYLMREQPDVPADNAPPAAIMIELAPEPEAANTEEEQISPDMQEQEQVMSEQAEPVEEPQPEPVEQPRPEPTPEPVAEPVEQPVEPPLQEVAEPVEPEPVQPPVVEPPPEPIEEIKPVEEQMTAALENVEVPLPVVRPLPPVEEKPPEQPKKPEAKKEPVKKVQKPKQQQQQQARPDMAEAKIQAKQSDRTAASQNSTSLFSSSVSPQQWMTRVRTKIARYARKCPGNGTGIVTVRFSFDGSGNIGNVSVAGSSGNASIDDYVASAVRRASPIPAPPSGVASSLSQPVKCE